MLLANMGGQPALKVDAMAILSNLRVLRNHTASKIMAVVKCDGYGLGLINYASMLSAMGIDWFAVGSAEEAMGLRRAGIQGDILVLTPVLDQSAISALIKTNVSMQLSSLEQLQAVMRASSGLAGRALIHLCLDTGLGRWGFRKKELEEALPLLKGLCIAGTYTHFSSPYKSERDTLLQVKRYDEGIALLEAAGIEPGVQHLCASGGFLKYPFLHRDMVRIGSALVGGVPNANDFGLAPVAQLSGRICLLKRMRKGERLGYDGAAVLKRDAEVAVVNVGKMEGIREMGALAVGPLAGLFGALRGRRPLTALVGGRQVSALGAPGTSHVCLDVTDAPVRIGDEALFSINPIYCGQTVTRIWTEEAADQGAKLRVLVTEPQKRHTKGGLKAR